MDTAIRVLMKAGAYTEDLRLAHEAGYDITGKGNTAACLKLRLLVCLVKQWMHFGQHPMLGVDGLGHSRVTAGA